MKILIVRTFPSIMDPKHYNVQEIGLAKALSKLGNQVGVVLYNGKNKDCREEICAPMEDSHAKIILYKLHGFGILKNGFFPSLKKIAKDYDVIQVHEYDQITSWFYYAFSKKEVVIYHGPYYDAFNKGYNLKCKLFDTFLLKLKNNKDRICFTKSHAAAEFLKAKGFRNVYPVGVGLDLENFTERSGKLQQEDLCNLEKKNLLYVGKIEERRNSMFLLSIMEKLCDTRKDIHFIVVGQGEGEYYQNFLIKSKRLVETGALSYCEKLTQKEIANLYQKVQLMVFPTNYDIYGMVVLEALYYQLPVISSFNGAADMLIQSDVNSVVIKDYELNNWCDKIEWMLEKDNYLRIKQQLEQTNSLKYSWDGIAAEMMKVLDKKD